MTKHEELDMLPYLIPIIEKWRENLKLMARIRGKNLKWKPEYWGGQTGLHVHVHADPEKKGSK